MSNVVKRLRKVAKDNKGSKLGQLCAEAADEIDKLLDEMRRKKK